MSSGMSALEEMFGGKKVSAVVEEAPSAGLIPDGEVLTCEIASVKIGLESGKKTLALAYQVMEGAYKNRFLYQNVNLVDIKVPNEDFDATTARKNYTVICTLLDLLYEGYAVYANGGFIPHQEPNGVAVAAILGRTVKFKVRHSKYTKPGETEKTYANPGFLFNVRKNDDVPSPQSVIPRLVTPDEKQQRLTKRLENDVVVLEIYKQIPRQFVVDFITDRIKPMEAIPRGTQVVCNCESAKSGVSAKGNKTLALVWKIIQDGNENAFVGRTIRETIALSTNAEKISNLFAATGLIQDDQLAIPAGLTPEEALVNRTVEFYTGVNEWNGNEYTTVGTEYFPDPGVTR